MDEPSEDNHVWDQQIEDDPLPVVIPYGPMYTTFRKDSFLDSILLSSMMLVVSLQFWFKAIQLPFDQPSARWWISFAAMFVHADLGHLLSNLLLFIPFAALLQAHYGRAVFPWFGLLIGYLTHLAVLLIKGDGYSLVGASGMVYGLGALWLGLFILHGNRYALQDRIIRSIGVMLILLFPTQFMPEVSYLAHGIGFLMGLAFVPLVARLATKSNTLYLPQMIWKPHVAVEMSKSQTLPN
jgi:membrane associated rhomboid family serine protease